VQPFGALLFLGYSIAWLFREGRLRLKMEEKK
jgi:hypothetical protein